MVFGKKPFLKAKKFTSQSIETADRKQSLGSDVNKDFSPRTRTRTRTRVPRTRTTTSLSRTRI